MEYDLTSIREEYPFTPKKLDLNGFSMSYLDEGNEHSPPILFVHGNPTWSFYWRNLVLALKDNYRCVAPDHIGCGLSDKPEDYKYDLEQRIDDLERLVESLELKNIILAVHDWGGAIGMGYAARHPENIRALVIFNTGAFRSSHMPKRIAICRAPVIGEYLTRGLNGFVKAAVTYGQATSHHERFKGALAKGYLLPYDSWANRVAVYNFVKDIPTTKDHPSYETLVGVEDGLVNFRKTPALMIWGKDDWCFNKTFYNEWMKRLDNIEPHMLENVGHFVVEDALERILPLMDGFLEGL